MKITIQIFLILVIIGCERKSHNRTIENKKVSKKQEVRIKSDSLNVLDRNEVSNLIRPIQVNQSRINQVKNWSKIDSLEILESTEGGTATFFYLGDSLNKIISEQYGEMGKRISEFYNKQGNLSLVYEKLYEYNRPIYWDSIRMRENNDNQIFDIDKSELIEYWTYFKNDKLITQTNNQEDCPTNFDYLEGERERLTSEYVKLLNIKR